MKVNTTPTFQPVQVKKADAPSAGSPTQEPKESWLEHTADKIGGLFLPAVDLAAAKCNKVDASVREHTGKLGQVAFHALRNGALGASYALAGALGGGTGVLVATAAGAGASATLARADGASGKDAGIAAEAGALAGTIGSVIGIVAGPGYGSAIAGGIGACHSLFGEALYALGA